MAVKSAGVGVALAGAFCLFAYPVQAAAQSSGSVTISAVVAPVRSIVVDSHHTIQEIASNTKSSVVPVVYEGSFNAAPIPLSPNIAGQYDAIMAQTNATQAGIIYVATGAMLANTEYEQSSLLAAWLRLNNYQDISLLTALP